MSLKAIASELEAAGVGYRVVTAKSTSRAVLVQRITEFLEKEGGTAQDVKEFYNLLKAPGTKLSAFAKRFKADFPHGVEYMSATHERSGKEVEFAYLNTGDTYNDTVLRNPISGKLELTTLGDMVEYLESKGYATAGQDGHGTTVVTAAEAKDPENPPYSRKRSITSLNDKRLLKVLSILDKCAGIAGTKTLRKKIKSYDVKEAGDFLVHMQAMCDSWNERMRDIFDIVKSLSGKDGINISGCYSAGSSNARLAIHHGDYKNDPVGTCDSVLTVIERAMRHVQAARKRVVTEALKRGIVDPKIDVANKHLFQ